VKNELIEGQRLAVDERGNVLVWTGVEVSAQFCRKVAFSRVWGSVSP